MTAQSRRLLATYLNDHLAGATAGSNLARSVASANASTPREGSTRALADQIEEDRRRLVEIMRQLGVARQARKQTLGALGERISRLKLSTLGTGSPGLAQVLRFETLIAGVTGKRRLWRALRTLALEAPLDAELDQLLQRAEQQLATLEQLHEEACREVFSKERDASIE